MFFGCDVTICMYPPPPLPTHSPLFHFLLLILGSPLLLSSQRHFSIALLIFLIESYWCPKPAKQTEVVVATFEKTLKFSPPQLPNSPKSGFLT